MFMLLENLINWFTYSLLNLEVSNHRAQALNFFIYDSIKIFFLLLLITFLMTLLNSYLPIEKIRNFLTKRKRYWLDHLLASFFGAITPFCSCSSIPLFVGFIKWWIPLGVTFSFLITSPLVNEVAIAMFLGIFWIKVTVIYMVSWIVLWILWWWILGKMWLEKYLADFIQVQRSNGSSYVEKVIIILKQRLKDVSKEARSITKKVMPYVLIWVAIGGAIHGFVPTSFFEKYITASNPLGVPLAVILWIPMYANAMGVIPIVQALIAKWVPLWTWLAFMMAVVWLSLPEFLILKKVMKIRLLLIFFLITGLCMILLGYFFNWVL